MRSSGSVGGVVRPSGRAALSRKQSADYRAVFTRLKDYALAGITYEVQFSADLNRWTPSNAGLTVEAESADNERQAVSVPFPATVPLFGDGAGSAPPKFFRVGITAN